MINHKVPTALACLILALIFLAQADVKLVRDILTVLASVGLGACLMVFVTVWTGAK